jgi:hypothetical protein
MVALLPAISMRQRCGMSRSGRWPTAKSYRRIGIALVELSPFSRSNLWPKIFSQMSYLPAVVGVAVIGDYKLRLLFDDGTAGDVDLFIDGMEGGLCAA